MKPQEDQKFLRFDDNSNTKLVQQNEVISGYSYRKVLYTHEDQWKKNFNKKIFSDPEFQIKQAQLQLLDKKDSKITLIRLYELYQQYPAKEKPQFFPSKDVINLKSINITPTPTFISELGLFPVSHYKSLFITQKFNEGGLYHIVLNQDGRFVTDVVDDIIPVYEGTYEPIWGMSLDNAWIIILLKFWAKKIGGYKKVIGARPFSFIEAFSNSNWKYFNLEKEGINFLNFYTADKFSFGKFILKTKDNGFVLDAGLNANSAGYELIMSQPANRAHNPKEKQWTLTIRSTQKNKWSGKMSIIDEQINSSYKPLNYTIRLERDFMMNHVDFLNFFSSAYISCSRSQHNYFSDYYLVNVPAFTKNAIYIKFQIPQDGFFDFAIKQFESNRKEADTNKSMVMIKKFSMNHDNRRYLRCHFILAKVKEKFNEEKYEQYHPLKYEAFEIEYFKGYNRGDARFEQIQKGCYMFRLRTQTIDRDSTFVINYTCNSKIKMRQVDLSKLETSQFLRQSMATFIDKVPNFSLDRKKKTNTIAYGELFEEVGYGFIGCKSKVTCEYNILIQIDPKFLNDSGYKLKNQFKNIEEPFSLLIKPGQTNVVVMKQWKEKGIWPPKGVQIFKQQ